jgi:hypothetical protein
MKRNMDSERDVRARKHREALERSKADLIASGESLLTADEWELPSDEILRLAIERHEAARAARRAGGQ